MATGNRTFFCFYYLIWVSCLFTTLFLEHLSAAEIELRSSVNKNKVSVGERVTLLLSLKTPKEKIYRLPILSGSLGEFEIKGYRLIKSISNNSIDSNFRVESIAYTVVGYTVGEHRIPTIKFRYGENTIATPEIPITIESVLAGEEDTLEPLKPNFAVRGAPYWWVYPGGILLLLLILYLLKKTVIFILHKRQLPYYEATLIQLDKLTQDITHQGFSKKHYFKLDQLIKHFYSEYRKNSQVLSMTGKQITGYIQKNPAAYNDFFTTFFSQSDPMKFAPLNPNPEIGPKYLREFTRIVEAVKTEAMSEKETTQKKTKATLSTSG